ncbi:uncharacterized protein METZ01_LOCUS50832 [marine metagenome]|uniref:Uncharacterized protein n=1 Tax=marine metagenome TaxID=408172 RepID=A0A381S3S1_9ZZZZ
MLSSAFPKKNLMAHAKGLSSDTASPSATTLLDSSTQEPTGLTNKASPSISTSAFIKIRGYRSDHLSIRPCL